jgi:hypothetical protein
MRRHKAGGEMERGVYGTGLTTRYFIVSCLRCIQLGAQPITCLPKRRDIPNLDSRSSGPAFRRSFQEDPRAEIQAGRGEPGRVQTRRGSASGAVPELANRRKFGVFQSKLAFLELTRREILVENTVHNSCIM